MSNSPPTWRAPSLVSQYLFWLGPRWLFDVRVAQRVVDANAVIPRLQEEDWIRVKSGILILSSAPSIPNILSYFFFKKCEAEFLSDGRVMVKTKLMGRYTISVSESPQPARSRWLRDSSTDRVLA